MDKPFYLETFQKAADQIDPELLAKNQLAVAVGVYGDAAFLKLFKKEWASPMQDPITAESRVFFSVWIGDLAIKEQKLLYNIHALKLRKLSGYVIESRRFAETFRADFKSFEPQWPNVSIKFGPLTLMQGWVKSDQGHLQREITALANQFFEIAHLIDDTLANFKR